ncbi:MAG: ATP-binding protein [Bacteroidota bacterium]
MKRVLPDSIAGRTMVVLVVGLTLSHVLSTAVYSTDRQNAVFETSERQFADRVAAATRLLERSGTDERRTLVEVLDSPLLGVSLSPEPAVAHDHADGPERTAVQAALGPAFGPLGPERLRVADRHAGTEWNAVMGLVHNMPENRIVQASVRLGDGTWANFALTLVRPSSLLSHRAILSTLIMALGVVLFSVWATRWIGQPLATFARAADRLGRDVNAAPLPPDGPREVRSAAAAFNQMQDRIRRFVEDRTRMLAAISHDLRSPITRLQLRAEMLPDGEARTRMLADLADMADMVSSTLEFARGEGSDEAVQAIDLAATLGAICDNASDIGLAAEYEWSGRLVCACRPLALKRALTNLVENAARYGGVARVRTTQHGRDIRVVIEDDGPGIPPESMEKVFTPFYRLEQSRNRKTGGMGLGMTVARTIVRAHGGDITLENMPEGGLRVIATLPQARGDE